MRLDYSPVEPLPPMVGYAPMLRRTLLLLTLLVITLAAVLGHEGAASRVPAAATENAVLFTPEPGTPAAPAEPLPVPEPQWVAVSVKRGQTLSALIEGEGLPSADWVALAALGEYGRRLKHLKPGETLRLRKDGGRLQELTYELGETQTLHLKRTGERFEAYLLSKELESRPTYSVGNIQSSLFNSGRDAGLSSALVMELAEIFGYDIDFALDIRENDRFTVIYEELFKDGKKLRDGNILAAEFVNQGRSVRAVRYTDPSGNTSYYTPEGSSLRRAFLRTPLDFARVTSSFSLARRHPILNKIRAHKGTDYGAATGTPIKAVGDGRIAFMGNRAGYGRVVTLRHGASYETLYAHMSRFRAGLGVGSRVKQGQVIGYVGKTGLATAPHLHYEFRVNGIHKNAMTVSLPRGNPLPQKFQEPFRASAAPLLAQIETLNRTHLAQAQ